MIIANIIATIRYHFPFFEAGTAYSNPYYGIWPSLSLSIFSMGVGYFLYIISKQEKPQKYELIVSYIIGIIFGLGLVISGMCRVSKVRGFLLIN